MSGCNCIDKVIRDWQKRTKNIHPLSIPNHLWLACELLKHYNIHDESQAVLCSLLCCHSRGLKKLATRGSATRPINNLYNFLEKTSRSEAKCSSRKNAENSLCAKITKVDLLFNVKLFVFSRKNIMLVDFDGLWQKIPTFSANFSTNKVLKLFGEKLKKKK